MALLTCNDVSFAYEGTPVLTDVTFSVNSGDYLCIIGENGSGKSYVVVTFLGILEMMKTGKFTIEQDKLFDDIIITYNPGKEQEEEQWI